jgi:hypothetical protein
VDVVAKRLSVDTAARGAAVGFAGLALFQLVLAAGAPLGRAAWGGAEAHLTTALRAGSALSVAFFVLAAAVVLRRAGYGVRWVPERLARAGAWALVVIMGISAFANLLSQSPWERFLLGPAALVLAALCAVVARAPRSERRHPASNER